MGTISRALQGPVILGTPQPEAVTQCKTQGFFFINFTMIPNEYPPSSIKFKKIWKLPTCRVRYIRRPPITLPQIVEGFTCVLLVLIKSGPWEMKRTKLDCYIDDIHCSQTYIRVCFHSSFLDCSQHTYPFASIHLGLQHKLPICIRRRWITCNIHAHLHLVRGE
jgi:hypothetical protein